MSEFFNTIHEGSEYLFFSNGEWRKSTSGKTIAINSPIDGSLVGNVQAITTGEVDAVFEDSLQSQKLWANYATEDRANILKIAADLIRQNANELADMKVLEIGKTKKAAFSSVMRSADIVSYTADQTELVNHQDVFFSKDFPGGDDKKTDIVTREPLGVVLAITPFNYPTNLAVTKIAPALITGNSVVVKGPTQGSICTAMLVEIFNKAGVPKGVISFVSGKGSEIGDYLISHKDVSLVDFTGSSEVGKGITIKAGLKPLILELGGKDAALVLNDCDLELAAERICEGAFSYSGQRCTAIKRVFVDKLIHDEFLNKLIEATKQKYSIVGDPRKDETQVGPIISEKQTDYVQELIFDAVESGAKIVLGGVRKANYMDATIIDGVTDRMRLAWEEQFGPVLPIISCDSLEQMIELHNKSRYGLGGSIFTRDTSLAKEIAKRLQTGVIQINAKSERYPDNFPFLGIKDSGLGIQGVRWSIEAMMRIKSVVENKV